MTVFAILVAAFLGYAIGVPVGYRRCRRRVQPLFDDIEAWRRAQKADATLEPHR